MHVQGCSCAASLLPGAGEAQLYAGSGWQFVRDQVTDEKQTKLVQ